MTIFQEMAFLLLPLLVGGKILSSERDGKSMDTSEKLECYVWGQCEEYSVNFEKHDTAEACHKFCSKNDDCKWWTWVQDNSLCSLFANCTDPIHRTGHPNAEPCSNCISGQHACHARDCHSVHKCQGILVDTKVMDHLEDCIYYCRDTVGCEWYTYNKKDDHCVLYENCNSTISCDTCASGPKDCSKGYHGDDEAVTEAVTEAVDKSWVCEINWEATYIPESDLTLPTLPNNDFDLRDIWGPSAPGNGKTSEACDYLLTDCTNKVDSFGRHYRTPCVNTYYRFKQNY